MTIHAIKAKRFIATMRHRALVNKVQRIYCVLNVTNIGHYLTLLTLLVKNYVAILGKKFYYHVGDKLCYVPC